MNKLAYILIPVVLAFGLFFGMAMSGAHEAVFGSMNMQKAHLACEGAWCGWLPNVTCTVHCLSSGLVQSLDSPVVILLSLQFVALLVLLIWLAVFIPQTRFVLLTRDYRPPPDSFHLTVQKRE